MRDITAFGLDRVRVNEGAEKCAAVFTDACKRGERAAAAMLEDIQTYPTLFLLMPQIEEYHLPPLLSPLKKGAYAITGQMLSHRKPSVSGGIESRPAGNGPLSDKNGIEHFTLKWMLDTGYNDSIDGEYDEVLDAAASVLINLYQDRSVLPLVADMIFARGRAGRNIHDLCWAFFRSRDPEALRLIARRMDSEEDSELACSLLGVEDAAVMGGGNKSGNYLRWLEDNREYLYFTDENFQLTARPSVCGVDLERKYIQKRARSRAREPVVPGDGNEGVILAAFRQLSGDDQAALSGYSNKLSGDRDKWSAWMALPIGEQLKEARKEGVVWL
jgi:hypothetical protein